MSHRPAGPTDHAPARDLDCLLVICPPWDTSQPPINLAYLAAFCRQRGQKVAAWDLNIQFGNRVRDLELKELWQVMSQNLFSGEELAQRLIGEAPAVFDDLVRQVAGSGARVLGFSVHSQNAHFTPRLVQALRRLQDDLTVIFGGPEVAVAHKVGTLQEMNADAFVIGEGEETLAEALSIFCERGRLEPVPGMVLRRAEGLTRLQPRPPIMDLDRIPFPRWEEFDLSCYRPAGADPMLPFLFSRGCTGRCRFCMDHFVAGRYRCRSATNAIEEIKLDIARFGTRHLHFNDLICNGNNRKLGELADGIVEAGLKISWSSYAVIRPNTPPELFARLRRSGCTALVFGMESASDRVLKLMNKHYLAADAARVLRSCSEAGIHTSINIIVGYPGETRVEHRQTMDFIRQNRRSIHRVVNLGTCLLSRGSEIHLDPGRHGIMQDEDRGTWHTEDGNTVEERNRRLMEMQALLDELGIPRVIINRERGFDQVVPGEGGAGAVGSLAPAASIYDIRHLDPAGRERREFYTGGHLVLLVRLQVHRTIEDPLIRFQIFNEESPGRENLMLYGMNNHRAGFRLGRIAPGRLELRLHLDKLHLLAGRYTTTCGIWPDEKIPTAHDVVHGGHSFFVEGQPDPSGARVAIPHRWEVKRGRGGPSTAGPDEVLQLRLTDAGGSPREVFQTRCPLRVRMECRVSRSAPLHLRVLLRHRGVPLSQLTTPGPLPVGDSTAELFYDPMILLGGTYQLEATLIHPQQGEPVQALCSEMRMESERSDGGGLIYMPCSWEVVG